MQESNKAKLWCFQVFVDALSGEAEGPLEAESELLTKTAEELEAVTGDSVAEETKIDDDWRGHVMLRSWKEACSVAYTLSSTSRKSCNM